MSSGSGKHDDAAYSTSVVEQTKVSSSKQVNLDTTPDHSQPSGQGNLPGSPSTQAQYANYDPEKLYGPSDEKPRNTISKHFRFDHTLIDFGCSIGSC